MSCTLAAVTTSERIDMYSTHVFGDLGHVKKHPKLEIPGNTLSNALLKYHFQKIVADFAESREQKCIVRSFSCLRHELSILTILKL